MCFKEKIILLLWYLALFFFSYHKTGKKYFSQIFSKVFEFGNLISMVSRHEFSRF